jgi:hypothetical protein
MLALTILIAIVYAPTIPPRLAILPTWRTIPN